MMEPTPLCSTLPSTRPRSAPHDRSCARWRLPRYNNADTNALVQAEYKIAFPQREWHVPGTLESHGLNLKAFDSLKLVDFKIDDPAQR